MFDFWSVSIFFQAIRLKPFWLKQARGSRLSRRPPGRHGAFRASQPPSGAVCEPRASVCAFYVLLGVLVRLWALAPFAACTEPMCLHTYVLAHLCVCTPIRSYARRSQLRSRLRSPLHSRYARGYARGYAHGCLLYTSPSPRDQRGSRMPSSA